VVFPCTDAPKKKKSFQIGEIVANIRRISALMSGCGGHIDTREYSAKKGWAVGVGGLAGGLALRVGRRVSSRVLLVVCDGGG